MRRENGDKVIYWRLALTLVGFMTLTVGVTAGAILLLIRILWRV